MNGQKKEGFKHLNKQTTHGWTDGQTDEWTNRLMDVSTQMDGQPARQTDKMG